MIKPIAMPIALLLLASGAIGCDVVSSKSERSNVEHASFAPMQRAPDFELKDIYGTLCSLTKSRDKAKLVMVHFWATWCTSCLTEMPLIQDLYNQYNADGFEVLSVNIDGSTNLEAVKSYVDKHNIEFPVLLDPSLKVVNQYKVTGFPETFFIDSNGKFVVLDAPSRKSKDVRIIGDLPWDSLEYGNAVREAMLSN